MSCIRRQRTGAAVFAFLLALLATSSAGRAQDATATDSGLAELLRDNGIRPVEPASPAADFVLPDLAGGSRALSDLHGRWVVLTFFATWCGPCRAEMPTLEALHQELGEAPITVLGVSVDQERGPLPAFLDSLGVTFPTLWDSQSQAARAYRAGSIPVSYVIDPSGRIVGVSRGARDWSQLGGMLRRALELRPAGQDLDNLYASTQQPVALPAKLTPPTATAELSQADLRVGDEFHLDVHIRWAGGFDEYLLLPPALDLPEGVEETGMSALTSTESGRNVLTYRVALAARQAGRFALDPVEVRYTPRFEEEPVAERVAGPTVDVAEAGLSPALMVTLAGSLAAVLGGLLATGFLTRSRKTGGAEPGEALAAARGHLDEARRQRLAGNDAPAVLELVAGFRAVGQEIDEGGTLAAAEERARYGGQALDAAELDRLQRRLQKILDERTPRADEAERRALRLAPKAEDRALKTENEDRGS